MFPIPDGIGGAIPDGRGKLDAEDLLKIVLVLVVVWIAIGVANALFSLVEAVFTSAVGVAIVVVILLWYFDVI